MLAHSQPCPGEGRGRGRERGGEREREREEEKWEEDESRNVGRWAGGSGPRRAFNWEVGETMARSNINATRVLLSIAVGIPSLFFLLFLTLFFSTISSFRPETRREIESCPMDRILGRVVTIRR